MIISTHQNFCLLLLQINNLINISPHSLTMMKIVNTETSSVEVSFTDQASKVLGTEHNVNMTLIIG